MKDDFADRRKIVVPKREDTYRPAQRQAGVDVVRVSRQEPAVPVVAAPPAVASVPVKEPGAPTAPVKKKSKRTRSKKKKSGQTNWGLIFRRTLGSIGALLILAGTGYVAFDTWITNTVVRKTTHSSVLDNGRVSTVDQEGTDESEVTTSAINSYVVAADMPRVLEIEKIGVRARILPMGITEDSAIQAPVNIFDSGWYTGSAKPGTPGVAFIDAHASGSTRAGLFAYVDTLVAGDTVTVERGDGERFTYEVREIETVKLKDIDMAKVLSPRGSIAEGLTLMTCTGKWMADERTYDQRVIVYAQRV